MVIATRVFLDKRDALMHHGIIGQKWGIKNGPPYPLQEGHSKKFTIDKHTAEVIGKAALGAALIGIGAYALANNPDLISSAELGEAFVSSMNSTKLSPSDVVIKENLGKSIDQIDREMVETINADVAGTPEGALNCFHVTTSYILNSLFGMKTKALGFSGVDELSGLVRGRDIKLYEQIFDNLEINQIEGKSFIEVFNDLKPGSTGILRISNATNGGHFINFEKDSNGVVSIVDGQLGGNKIIDGKKWLQVAEQLGYETSHTIDFSKATIKEGSKEILKNIVR